MGNQKTTHPRERPVIVDEDVTPRASGVELPRVGPRENVLVDDDEKVCRVISDEEVDAWYVDNGINMFKLRAVDYLTLDCDKEIIDIWYAGMPRKAGMRLGSISLESGKRATQYKKSKGVIYPIDDRGNVLLNQTNTPNLVFIRAWYHKEAQRVHAERVQLAEVVHAFASAIGALGNARGSH
jgi:hypothetical protein